MLRALLTALALLIAAGTGAQTPSDLAPAKKAAAPKAAAPKSAKAKQPKPDVRPAWAELTAAQQEILAPLKSDWDSMERERRLKWIALAKRYPRMTPLAQQRVQHRMQAWASLSPEQRRQARENYKRLAKKAPRNDQKKDLRQKWAEYQALPPGERQSLVPAPSTDPRRKR